MGCRQAGCWRSNPETPHAPGDATGLRSISRFIDEGGRSAMCALAGRDDGPEVVPVGTTTRRRRSPSTMNSRETPQGDTHAFAI